MKRYKLTTQAKTTHNGYQLPEDGVWFYPENRKDEPRPCSNTVLHHYAHPALAVICNPIHADYRNPRLFEIQVAKELGTDGLKGWSRAQRIVREVPLPDITTRQKAAFAIKVALLVCKSVEFVEWANKWLSGEDTTANAANAAADAAYAASAAANAASAANAAYAASAASAAADAAYAASAASAAAYAASAAADAANAAADAAFSKQVLEIINDVLTNF